MASFGSAKLLQLLRCSLFNEMNPALDLVDIFSTSVIQRITKSDLSQCQWLQAMQPISQGQQSLNQEVSSLALPDFWNR
jgi:hypothetical protein